MKPAKQAEIAQLIEEHKNLIYKVVNGYCTNLHEQEDLIQEIIFQLIKSYAKFDHKVKVTTWMYRVAINVSISHYRRVKTQQKHFVPLNDQLVHIEAENETNTNENLLRLRTFIQELDPFNKAILIMYLDENSHAEIAAAMGISVSNVGTKINRIKKQLHQKFNA